MKRKLIAAAIVLALVTLAIMRYTLVEVSSPLPDDVLLGSLSGSESTDTDTQSLHAAAPTPTAAPTPEPTPVPIMQSGSSGEDVKTLQTHLRLLGFMTGSADGHYGPKTAAAVQKLQAYLSALNTQAEEESTPAEDTNISPAAAPADSDTSESTAPQDTQAPDEETPAYSGAVDQALWDFLTEGGFSVYQKTVSSGSSGLDVERVQTRLVTLGYLSNADGSAGRQTVSAIRAFQSANGLSADGVAGKRTQTVLFSSSAKRYVKPAAPSKRYMLKIDTAKQRVYAYAWSTKSGSYSDLARTMVCSTGKDATPTPKGTFTSTSPVARWGYFPKYDVWAQYLYRINGSILFHSVLYTDSNEDSLISGSLYKLGTKASHGCVRLSVADAKWIYNNCPAGTTVKVV